MPVECKPASRIQAVEMSFLRGACGVNRMDGESNDEIYERFDVSLKGEGAKCGVVKGVKRNILRWFGHMERIDEGAMTRRVYKSSVDFVGRRGRPQIKWEDRVQEYVKERKVRRVSNLGQARRECKDRSEWRLFCRGHPLGGVPRNRRQT